MSERHETLVPWAPREAAGKTPSFGDVSLDSAQSGTLTIVLPYEEGKLWVRFNDVRSFATTWDGDPDPYLAPGAGASRPGDLLKVAGSRWLTEDYFYLGIDSGTPSTKPWEHFWIVASERSIHIAARDDIDARWIGGTWSGGPGGWGFTADA